MTHPEEESLLHVFLPPANLAALGDQKRCQSATQKTKIVTASHVHVLSRSKIELTTQLSLCRAFEYGDHWNALMHSEATPQNKMRNTWLMGMGNIGMLKDESADLGEARDSVPACPSEAR